MTEPKTSGNGSTSPIDPEKMHDRTMNGLITRQAVVQAVDRHTFDTQHGLCLDTDITCILEEVPPAKPAQTTCRECRWLRPNNSQGRCTVWHRDITDPEGYCHKGAGRDETGKQEARQ